MPAIAVCQAPSKLALPAPSRASPLPQWFWVFTDSGYTHSTCGSWLASDSGMSGTIDVELTGLIASRLAPTNGSTRCKMANKKPGTRPNARQKGQRSVAGALLEECPGGQIRRDRTASRHKPPPTQDCAPMRHSHLRPDVCPHDRATAGSIHSIAPGQSHPADAPWTAALQTGW